MATVLKRQESRRRLAAITFLSNISLDGTHRDTKLAPFINNNRDNNSHHHNNNHHHHHNQLEQQENQVDRSSSGRSSDRSIVKVKDEVNKNAPSPAQSRRQSCSLPLGQHCSSKEIRSPIENDGNLSQSQPPASTPAAVPVIEGRARLSSFGSYKRNRHNLPSSSIISCESIVSIGIQQRSRNGSVNRSGDALAHQNLGKSVNDTRHSVRFIGSPRDQPIQNNEKIVFVTSKRAPIALLSLIPYSRKSNYSANREIKPDLLNKRRHAPGTRQLSTITDGPDPLDLLCLLGFEKPVEGQEVSYCSLLSPSLKSGQSGQSKKPKLYQKQEHAFVGRCISYDSGVPVTKPQIGGHYLLHQMTAPPILNDTESNLIRDKHQYHVYYNPTFLKYNPDILDDPELIAGKHSTLLDFPSYLTSIINYVKPSDLKKELNEKFKERFPYIQLTLSKMRSLKRDMCKIAKHEGNIDYLTVAQAYVYFEKLILKLLINKHNRKLCAGACLLLSAKLNDVKGAELKKLIERIENIFRVDRKDLFAIEFTVLVALEFGLHLPINETLSHYQRLMYET